MLGPPHMRGYTTSADLISTCSGVNLRLPGADLGGVRTQIPKIFNSKLHMERMVFFTVAEANAILPDVVKKFEMILAKKSSVSRAQARVESAINSSLSDFVAAKQQLNQVVTEYYLAIQTLEETGVAIKSIEQGLLDFPAKMFDDEVWLCWKYNEEKIAFWHEKDSGFINRKPLATSDKSWV